MFTTKHSIATLYVSGVFDSSKGLAERIIRHGFGAFTILAGLGVWKGEHEVSYVITIIGETAAPAHLADFDSQPAGGVPILMPADPTAFEGKIRTLAENLAMDYNQDAVAFTIAPCLFELTTGQAKYKRNG